MGSRKDDPGCGTSYSIQLNSKKSPIVMSTKATLTSKEFLPSLIGPTMMFGGLSKPTTSHIASSMTKVTHQWGTRKIRRRITTCTMRRQKNTNKLKTQIAKLNESIGKNDDETNQTYKK